MKTKANLRRKTKEEKDWNQVSRLHKHCILKDWMIGQGTLILIHMFMKFGYADIKCSTRSRDIDI